MVGNQSKLWFKTILVIINKNINNYYKITTYQDNNSQFISAPGLTHFPDRIGVVAKVTVTMTSAPDAASSTVEQAFAPISSAKFCALAKVLLHTLI